MLETVIAERFDGIAQGGATEPLKMGCKTSEQAWVDVYVKCTSPQCPPGGLVRDLVGSLLARTLGLDVGIPVLVSVPLELIEAIKMSTPAIGARLSNSVVPSFGSTSLGGGYQLVQLPLPQSNAVRVQAAELWAFDQLICNPDRNLQKPNCLIKGEKLALIDHEKALDVTFLGFLSPAPWDEGWLPDRDHLVHDALLGAALPLERLKEAWFALTEGGIRSLCSLVPQSWNGDVAGEICQYLVNLQANLQPAFNKLERSFL
jgi:hypothetical protein